MRWGDMTWLSTLSTFCTMSNFSTLSTWWQFFMTIFYDNFWWQYLMTLRQFLTIGKTVLETWHLRHWLQFWQLRTWIQSTILTWQLIVTLDSIRNSCVVCILCTRPKSCFGGVNEQSGYLVSVYIFSLGFWQDAGSSWVNIAKLSLQLPLAE